MIFDYLTFEVIIKYLKLVWNKLMKNKIKVLIVDDSALVRNTMEQMFLSDTDIQVIGKAADPSPNIL